MSFHFPAQLTSCALWMEAGSHTTLLNIDQSTVQHIPDERILTVTAMITWNLAPYESIKQEMKWRLAFS